MAVQDTDTFLVNRSNASYAVAAENLAPKPPSFSEVSGFPVTGIMRGGEVSGQTVIFCAQNAILRSTDGGTTFTQVSNKAGLWMDSATDGSGTWIACDADKTTSRTYGALYSTDNGATWQDISPSNVSNAQQSECCSYGNGIWSIGTYANIVYASTSPDFSTNRTVNSITNTGGAAMWATGLIYNGSNKWVLSARSGNNRVATSTDGRSFTGNTGISSSMTVTGKSCYHDGYFYIGGISTIHRSADGVNWDTFNIPLPNNNGCWDVQISDSGRLYALFYAYVAYSDNGTDWEYVALPGDGGFGFAVVGEKVIVPTSNAGKWFVYDPAASGGSGGGPPQANDLFLVNRGGTSYKCEFQNLKSKVQDSDLLLANRNGSSYKVTGADFKEIFG